MYTFPEAKLLCSQDIIWFWMLFYLLNIIISRIFDMALSRDIGL